jgi:hypothetical protein
LHCAESALIFRKGKTITLANRLVLKCALRRPEGLPYSVDGVCGVHLALEDAVFDRVDAHALFRHPLDPGFQVRGLTVELQHGPGDLGRDVGAADVGDQVEARRPPR